MTPRHHAGEGACDGYSERAPRALRGKRDEHARSPSKCGKGIENLSILLLIVVKSGPTPGRARGPAALSARSSSSRARNAPWTALDFGTYLAPDNKRSAVAPGAPRDSQASGDAPLRPLSADRRPRYRTAHRSVNPQSTPRLLRWGRTWMPPRARPTLRTCTTAWAIRDTATSASPSVVRLWGPARRSEHRVPRGVRPNRLGRLRVGPSPCQGLCGCRRQSLTPLTSPPTMGGFPEAHGWRRWLRTHTGSTWWATGRPPAWRWPTSGSSAK